MTKLYATKSDYGDTLTDCHVIVVWLIIDTRTGQFTIWQYRTQTTVLVVNDAL